MTCPVCGAADPENCDHRPPAPYDPDDPDPDDVGYPDPYPGSPF